MKRARVRQVENDRERRARIIHAEGEPRAWLPRIRPALAPRLHALLEPDSLAADGDSAELLVQACMEDALRGRATDIHFEPISAGCRIRFRIDGHVHDAAQTVAACGEKMIRFLRVLAGLDPVASYTPQEAAFQYGFGDSKVDVRLSCAPCQGGVKLTLRLLDPQRVQRRLEDLGLGMPNLLLLERWTAQAVGMCLLMFCFGSQPASIRVDLTKGQWMKKLDSSDMCWNGPGSEIPMQLKVTGRITLALPPTACLLLHQVKSL